MVISRKISITSILFLFLIIPQFSQSGIAQAAMVATEQALSSTQADWQRAQVNALLAREQIRESLLDHGVSPEYVVQRVASLTDTEVSALHRQLEDAPAGAGIVGLAVTVFIVFVITDMLCATDIFSFVKCINK